MQLIIHTDGGARGNPGPAAVGVVIDQEKKRLAEFAKTIGETTNNVAEYTAVIEALKWLKNNGRHFAGDTTIQFFLDSNLVVQQLNGKFKVKEPRLRDLLFTVRALEQEVKGEIHYRAVPREQNRRADFLLNQALDKRA